MQAGEPPVVPVNIFRHPLLQDFMLTLFCKLPVVSGLGVFKGVLGLNVAAAVLLLLLLLGLQTHFMIIF
jgi:hypothetical protein